MPRRIGYALAFCAAAAGLAWAGWPGVAGNPATLIGRADVIATVVIIAVLPWAVRRVFGPVREDRLARIVRAGGCVAAFALVLVKAEAERPVYAALSGRPVLAGLWVGEAIFLVVMAVYVAGLLAATAQRAPAGPAAVAIGTAAGVAIALVVYALSALRSPPPAADAWLAGLYVAARVLAVLLVPGIAVAAGLAAARRTPDRGGQLPLADTRARQGVAAGLSAGTAAALLAAVLGIGTIALLPREAGRFEWVLPNWHLSPAAVFGFELGVSHGAAGYLLVLVMFPLLGAGLGAWGGLFAAGQPGQRPGGGGGGGGPDGPAPAPPPPAGGRHLAGGRGPARRVRAPSGAAGRAPARRPRPHPRRRPARPRSPASGGQHQEPSVPPALTSRGVTKPASRAAPGAS